MLNRFYVGKFDSKSCLGVFSITNGNGVPPTNRAERWEPIGTGSEGAFVRGRAEEVFSPEPFKAS